MDLSSFTEGLSIFRKYYLDPAGYHLGADHNQIYLYPTDLPMTAEDVATVRDLGWFQDSSLGDKYDQDESWTCVV